MSIIDEAPKKHATAPGSTATSALHKIQYVAGQLPANLHICDESRPPIQPTILGAIPVQDKEKSGIFCQKTPRDH